MLSFAGLVAAIVIDAHLDRFEGDCDPKHATLTGALEHVVFPLVACITIALLPFKPRLLWLAILIAAPLAGLTVGWMIEFNASFNRVCGL